jgi:sporulation protein YlmC with PRC-barrel domain
MASQGQEALCLELVKQLEAAVKEHREHAHTLQQVEKYATPVAIGSYAEQLDTSRLIGMSVRNRVGEELGVVQGVVIDTQEGGRANALVIEHGGFLGMGETRVEVPWKDVQITRDGSSIVLDMTAEALNEQPEAE